MKRALMMLALAMVLGCDTTPELAPNNMKKGDQYLAEKDYDVAEYYYEKIPDSSPLYKEAQLKLKQIVDIRAGAIPKVSAEAELQKVSVFEQSIIRNDDGKTPIHNVSLNNESTHKLVSVQLEFTYFDGAGNLIGLKRCTVNKAMSAKTQETFTNIAPGTLDVPCASSKVKVISAEFQ